MPNMYDDSRTDKEDLPFLYQLFLSFALFVFCGLTIMFMWNWYVFPLGLPLIGLVQALGIDMLVTFIVTTKINTRPTEPFIERWTVGMLYALCTLGIGWLLHFFI